jgi:hypothetical protein
VKGKISFWEVLIGASALSVVLFAASFPFARASLEMMIQMTSRQFKKKYLPLKLSSVYQI